MKVLVLGGVSYDEIIHVDEFFKPTPKTIFPKAMFSAPGSTGYGKALAFRKLGYNVVFQAPIGDDLEGQLIKTALREADVDFYPAEAPNTEKHVNIMNKAGERISLFQTVAPTEPFIPERYEELIREADFIVLNIIDYCRRFIPLIRKYKKPVFVDLHDYEPGNPYHEDFIAIADGIHLSSDKMKDYRNFMKKMIASKKRWVVVTHGAKGASGMDTDNKLTEIAADKIEVVDANGAGDNFFAGFVHGILQEYSLNNALIMGKLAANDCIASKEIVGVNLNQQYLEKKLAETEKNS